MTRVKLIHWNVNGIRAIMRKDVCDNQSFEKCLINQNADILVFTETKISSDVRDAHADVNALFPQYPHQYHAHAIKKGYSGVSIYSKIKPIRAIPTNHDEGRLVILEYAQFILIGVYTPNSGSKLLRLSYRTRDWDAEFLQLCQRLSNRKPLIIAGDLNTAYMDIDIYKPDRHHSSAGFTDAERGNFDRLLRECNLLDTWRMQHERRVGYTYFDYRTKARARNAGWRIDYVLMSSSLESNLHSSAILDRLYGSDHLPISATFKF